MLRVDEFVYLKNKVMAVQEFNKTTIVVKAAMSMVSNQVRQPKAVRTGAVSRPINPPQPSTILKTK